MYRQPKIITAERKRKSQGCDVVEAKWTRCDSDSKIWTETHMKCDTRKGRSMKMNSCTENDERQRDGSDGQRTKEVR